MGFGRKITLAALLFVFFFVSACARYHYEGGAAGGLMGGIAGALLDRKNPWRGGVIGAGLGAVAGATIADISVRGSQEAARANRPVEYTTDNGRGVYRAEPMGADERTNCKKVRERVWEDDRLVKDRVKEVCESEKLERRY